MPQLRQGRVPPGSGRVHHLGFLLLRDVLRNSSTMQSYRTDNLTFSQVSARITDDTPKSQL